MESDDDSESTTTGAHTPNVSNDVSHSANSGSEANPVPAPTTTDSASSSRTPSFTSIGSPEVPTHQELKGIDSSLVPQQLKSDPGGDAHPAIAKVEGLMDTSESPLKL